jgi:hypothetical protein
VAVVALDLVLGLVLAAMAAATDHQAMEVALLALSILALAAVARAIQTHIFLGLLVVLG